VLVEGNIVDVRVTTQTAPPECQYNEPPLVTASRAIFRRANYASWRFARRFRRARLMTAGG